MNPNYVTIKVDKKLYDKIKNYYSNFIVANKPGEYVDYIAKYENTQITGYESTKSKQTVVFLGTKCLSEAKKWDTSADIKETKKEEPIDWVNLNTQIGSDEVGVGDLYLPMIVCAAYVREDQITRLKELGIMDSKKMTDDYILAVGPTLIKEFEYSKLTLPNEKYNEMYAKGENINSLKAKMHNRALANLIKKHPEVKNVFLDQFAEPKTYYGYFDAKDEPIVRNITFHTKGESYYPSVAVGSVIARYALLIEKQKFDDQYGVKFPFGAGSQADKFTEQMKKKMPKEALDKLVKLNFKNYK